MVTPRKTPSDRKPAAKKAAAAPAARSGNPARRAKPTQATAASAWGGGDATDIVELPSGNAVEIERVPLTTLLSEGLLADALGSAAMAAISSGSGVSQDEMKAMAEDPQKIAQAIDAMDKVAVRCFVDPQLVYFKDDDGKIIPKSERDPDLLYSDKVSLEDKVYLFQLVGGGSEDLATFRQQFDASMAGVAAQ